MLEYKVKGDLICYTDGHIPVSIALAQAAKESGWELALEGNAIFVMDGWTRHSSFKKRWDKNHKILKFPILRASVKAIKIANTHKVIKNLKIKENN